MTKEDKRFFSFVGLILVIIFLMLRIVQLESIVAVCDKERIDTKIELQELKYSINVQRDEIEDLTEHILTLRKDINVYIAMEWAEAYYDAGRETHLDPKFLIAIGIIESGIRQATGYGVTLVSVSGAEGIMQVMSKYWGYGEIPFVKSPKDLKHPTINIRAGAYIFRHYLDMYGGDYKLALLAYNRGEWAVNRDLEKGRDPANGYAYKVMARATRYL